MIPQISNCQGINVELRPSQYEETLNYEDFDKFSDFVEETALQKVLEVSNRLKQTDEPQPDVIIGADTMVTMDGKMFGKPKSEQDAIDTLRK